MTIFLKFVLSISLLLVTPYPASASNPSSDVFHQFMVEQVTHQTLDQIAKIKTGKDAIIKLVPLLRPEDRAFAIKHLSQVKTFPKFTRLNRGFSYTYQGKTTSFVIKDLFTSQYVVNEKIPLTYSRSNSLKIQIESAANALNRQTAGLDWLFPRAHAIDVVSLAAGAVITLVIGGVVMPLVEFIRNEYIRPKWDSYYCEGKDPNDYRYSKSCGEYFKWKAAQRSSIPDATPVPKGQEVLPLTPKPPKCYSEESPTFQQEFESADKKEVIRRTIRYDENRKAKEMIEEMVRPPNDRRLVYKLNDQGQLFELWDGDRIMLTRDPKKKEIMTADGFAEMDQFDSVISYVLASIKLCDEAAQAKLKRAAEQPGSLVAKHVLTEGVDSVPGGAVGPEATK